MSDSAIFGAIVLAGFIVVGIVARARLNRIAFRYREELFTRATELLNDPQITASDRAFLNWMMDRALKFSSGWIVLAALFSATSRAVHRAPAPAAGNVHVRGVISRFVVSALAANPVALAIFIPMIFALALFERERVRRAVVTTANFVPSAALHQHQLRWRRA